MTIANKAVLVTGANRGIGHALVEEALRRGASRVYAAATAVSLAVLAVAVVGGWIAWRRGYAIGLPMLLIAHIPMTLAFVLTNMRYSIAVQPFVFVFVAVAIVAGVDAASGRRTLTDGRDART